MPTRRDKTGPLNNHFLRPASLSLTTSVMARTEMFVAH